MFTTDPTLAQRIERMIGQTPVVDAHAHISPLQPQSTGLGALFREHSVRAELWAVGQPADAWAETLPEDEQVRRALPYLARMRNTSVAWCLYRIFRDLYDFHDPHLTEANYRELFDKVSSTGRDPSWPGTVLRDRAKVQRIVTSRLVCGSDSKPSPIPIDFRLNLHYLFRPGWSAEPTAHFVGRASREEYYPALCEVLGESPATAVHLEQLLFDWLSKTLCGATRFACARFSLDSALRRPDPSDVDSVLTRAFSGGIPLTEEEVETLISFVTWTTLAWHHVCGKAIQLTLSLDAHRHLGEVHAHAPRVGLTELMRALTHFTNTRFELLASTESVAQEVTALCAQFPNAYAAGCWGHAFTPAGVERTIGLRATVVPMTKFTAFVSDASTVEWVYAKALLARKATASAFARLVEAGYYEEDELPLIFRQIFHNTPRDLYDLGKE
jgi:glucuronate isomerase